MSHPALPSLDLTTHVLSPGPLGAIRALLALSTRVVEHRNRCEDRGAAGASSRHEMDCIETCFGGGGTASSLERKDDETGMEQTVGCPDCGMNFAGNKWLRVHRRWCEAHQRQPSSSTLPHAAVEDQTELKEEKRGVSSGKARKRMWTEEEDQIVIEHVTKLGKAAKWTKAAALLPDRNGKNVRERWYNHLDPNINKKPWTEEEDKIVLQAQIKFGNQWRYISTLLPGRTDNAIKNHRNSTIRRRIMTSGIESYGFIDGVTNGPPEKLAALDSICPG